MEAREKFLSRVSVFSPLRPEVVALLASQTEEVNFVKGQTLIRQGEGGDFLMVIQRGSAQVSTFDAHRNRHDIARLGPGHIIGEMALLTDEPRTASVTALTSGDGLTLSADRFERLAAEHSEISVVLTRLVAQRLGVGAWDALAGKTFGDWEVGRRLGRGGMSVVYEGRRVDSGRRAALKMLSHRLVYDARSREQFQREAEIVSTFDHPNITAMLGRFQAFRTYFIAMEYCDGATLDEVLEAARILPPAVVKKIAGNLAAALRYAHRAGVVHRDVKPANVMINRDGGVKLMDFGLAEPIDRKPFQGPAPMIGTPRYMSPEQLAGTRVDERSDLFGLGLVIYETLAGEPLFSMTDFGQLLSAHLHWTPPDFDKRFPDADEELCKLLSSVLAADANDRSLNLDNVAAWAGALDASELPWDALTWVDDDETRSIGPPDTLP